MKTVSYKKILREKLDDPEQAAEYLTACCEEGPEVFFGGGYGTLSKPRTAWPARRN